MFDDLNKQPDDIFAETDKSAPQVAVVPPSEPSQPAPTASAPSGVEARMAEMVTGRSSRGGLKTAVIVLAIIVIIGGAFLISWKILTSQTPVTPSAPETTSSNASEPATQEPAAAEPTPAVTPEPEPTPIVPADIDSDQDGLLDSQEAQYGTNSNSPDTDADGLFDREEIEVYQTDPLNPDTDSDTYLDGAEVKSGYNPKGLGKFFEVPKGS
ncbi:hypothetical protein HZA85_02575 [Candidatus Uhrbacteria bacterium]|nr:hypothetical protein [Candidatus Uhrbacteria bacterium]